MLVIAAMRIISPLERLLFWGVLLGAWYLLPFVFINIFSQWGVSADNLAMVLEDNSWLIQAIFLVLSLFVFGKIRRLKLKESLLGKFPLKPYLYCAFSEFCLSVLAICGLVALCLVLGFSSLEIPSYQQNSIFHFLVLWSAQAVVLIVWVLALERLRYELWQVFVHNSPNKTMSILVLSSLEFVLYYKLFIGNFLIQDSFVLVLCSLAIFANILTTLGTIDIANSLSNSLLRGNAHARRVGWSLGFWATSYLIFGQWRAGFKGASLSYIFTGTKAEFLGEEIYKIGWWGQSVPTLMLCMISLAWFHRQIAQAQMVLKYQEIFDAREVVKALSTR